jgi:purine-binding chemotaxis protein CheW
VINSLDSGAGGVEYVTFGLGNAVYGIELSQVRELVGVQEVARLPAATPFIRGVVELRGKPIIVADLRVKLGMPAVPMTRRSIILMVRIVRAASPAMTGLLVDEVFGVASFVDPDVVPTPPIHSQLGGPLVQGITKLDERLIVLLALERLLSAEQQTELGNLTEQLTETRARAELHGSIATGSVSDAVWSNA